MVAQHLVLGELKNVHGVPRPEEKRLEERPDLRVAPMLAEYISRVDFTREMEEDDDLGSNGFADTVKREGRVPLVELGMWNHRAINHTLVVSEHEALIPDGNAKVAQRSAQIKNLFHTGSSSDKLRAIGGGLYRGLFLGVPVNGVLLTRCKIPVMERPVSQSWKRLAST